MLIKSFMLSLFILSSAFGIDYTLVKNGYWGNQSSWTPPGVPGIDDNIFVPLGFNCFVSENVSCNSMLIEGILNIEPGNSLSLYGDSFVFGVINMIGTVSSPTKLLIGNDLSIGGQLSTIEMWNGIIDSIDGEKNTLTLKYVQRGREVHPPLRLIGDGNIRIKLINQVWVWASHEGQVLKLSAQPKIGIIQPNAGKSAWDAQFGGILKINTEVSGESDWVIIYSGDVKSKCIINSFCKVSGNIYIVCSELIINGRFCTSGSITGQNSIVKIKGHQRSTIGVECE